MFSFLGLGSRSEKYDIGQPLVRYSGERTRRGSIVILVLGRSGVGKSHLISAVCDPERNKSMPKREETSEVTAYRTTLSEVRYRLIDTPGFDNLALDDIDICARIIKYLRESGVAKNGVHGILYIHQSGDPLQSYSFYRYLTAISKVFFGSIGPRRLTVFIRHVDPNRPGNTDTDDELRNKMSTLGRLCAMGAQVVVANDQTKEFIEVLESYASTNPAILPVQQDRPNLIADLEAILQISPSQGRSSHQEERIKRSYERKLQDLRLILDTKDSDLVQYRDAFHRTEKLRATLQETEATLRQQLQQVQQEYASLRSELQLQENFEQSDIVQELEDLNRHIDDISRSISAHLTDNYVREVFDKDPATVSSLDARNRPELIKLLKLQEGRCSLVSSAEGKGLDIENFLDFTIRDMLCTLLFVAIFQPFHPAIGPEQNHTLLRAYEDIRTRESQTKSGKWRSSTYISIYENDNSEQVTTWINELLRQFTTEYLDPLIMCVFGSEEVKIDAHHPTQMHELVKRAWEWNYKLKGEVIVLGDFRQTIYAPCTDFDPSRMRDFESQPNLQPTSVLGTVGLGLVASRAVGGGQLPEETIVCKTIVTTDSLYAWFSNIFVMALV